MNLLQYTHPAAMKYEVNKAYSLDELKTELSDEMIKILFTPLNFKWETEVKVEKINNKQTAVEAE